MGTVADKLVEQFDRMVKRDGGRVSLLQVEGDLITVGYHPGVDPTCTDGVCVLPHRELEQLMAETLARRDAAMRVRVQLIE